MAGEWIKLRTNLWDDPRIARLCDLTEQPEAMVIGGLYWLWAMADEHTEDGLLNGLTLRAIDRKTGVAGLAAALVQVGWLREAEQGVEVVNFDEHNGVSAKRRCMEAKRKAGSRNVSASHADNVPPPCGAREEKNIKPSHSPACETAAPAEQPVGHSAAEEMTLEWQPDERKLAAYALRAGVPLAEFTPEATAPFVLHHCGKGGARPHSEWVAALVRWVLGDRQRAASRVVPLRGGSAPAEDWAAAGVVV